MAASDRPRFGRYNLLQRIAAGGMGEVHLAKLRGPAGFEKLLVIKRLLNHRQQEQKYIEMFFSEARVAAQLNHSNIVQVFEVGNHDGVHYIAMEYVQGKSLRILIDTLGKQGLRIAPAYALEVCREVCAGLSFAHSARHFSGAPMELIHRDVNPHNILLSFQGEVKIIDFGIAKSELSSQHTQAGTIKGTVVYMSPEQSSGQKLDRRSDIFSLGICLYEMLTGTNPFYKDSLTGSLEAIRTTAYPPLETVRPDLAHLAPVVHKALARTTDTRYQSCDAFADALQDLLDQGTVARPPQSLAQYLRSLYANDIAELERLLSQTELAERESLGLTSPALDPMLDATQSAVAPPTLAPLAETPPPRPTAAPRTPGRATPLAEEPTVGSGGARGDVTVPAEALSSTEAQDLRASDRMPGWQRRLVERLPPWTRACWEAPEKRYGSAGIAVAVIYLAVWAATPAPQQPDSGAQAAAPSSEATPKPQAPDAAPAAAAPEPALNPPQQQTAAPQQPRPLSPAASAEPHTLDEPDSRRAASAPASRRPPLLHRHLKSLPPHSADAPGVLGILQLAAEPAARATIGSGPNAAALGPQFRMRAAAGTLRFGDAGGKTDSYVITVHYRIDQKNIVYTVESDPWANVYGPGGIPLGRTPLSNVAGSGATVFEFRNPSMPQDQRVTLRFTPAG